MKSIRSYDTGPSGARCGSSATVSGGGLEKRPGRAAPPPGRVRRSGDKNGSVAGSEEALMVGDRRWQAVVTGRMGMRDYWTAGDEGLLDGRG